MKPICARLRARWRDEGAAAADVAGWMGMMSGSNVNSDVEEDFIFKKKKNNDDGGKGGKMGMMGGSSKMSYGDDYYYDYYYSNESGKGKVRQMFNEYTLMVMFIPSKIIFSSFITLVIRVG